jgi:hypothetical protein
MILGILFLGCALLLIGAFFFALVGTAIGSVEPPKDFHDLLGTLCMLGVSFAMMGGTLALGVFLLNASLLPKTLEITGEGIELRWFKKQIGNIPLDNVKDVIVKTRAMAGQTAQGAFWQASLRGGLIGGLIAQSRFNPDEPIGFIIKLATDRDPDTFWPRGYFQKSQKKRIEVAYYWTVPHDRLVEKIDSAVARHKKQTSRSLPKQ